MEKPLVGNIPQYIISIINSTWHSARSEALRKIAYAFYMYDAWYDPKKESYFFSWSCIPDPEFPPTGSDGVLMELHKSVVDIDGHAIADFVKGFMTEKKDELEELLNTPEAQKYFEERVLEHKLWLLEHETD